MIVKMRNKLAQEVSQKLNLSHELVLDLLERPKSLEHGELALPIFRFAKPLAKSPTVLAAEWASKLSENMPFGVQNITPVSGFINFLFEPAYVIEQIFKSVREEKERLGYSDIGKGKKLLVEYSSPNVAKPMSIGHLRATVIGQAIRNVSETQGFDVVGINHLGDWGIQFGKLAWAYDNWKSEYNFEEAPFDALFKMYVRFHAEEEVNPQLGEFGSEYFRRLESGDSHVRGIWRLFLDISLKEYQGLYDLLGVRFDVVQGEAFYNDKLSETVERLKNKGVLEESEGAQVVFLDDLNPPCIVIKSDGSSLYATRDLASAIYRKEVMRGDIMVYVVGMEQSLHFQQVFGVLKKMGYDWAENLHHVAFGLYRFKDIGKMSTRKGNVIFMRDVFDKAIAEVRSVIQQKNPDLENKEAVATQVGVGAIVFNDLMNDRVKNVDFDWQRALDFEGDSGPYVQYSLVRCKSVMRKFAQALPESAPTELSHASEYALLRELLYLPDVFSAAYRQFKPNLVAQYLLEVCRKLNQFYHNCKILTDDLEQTKSRVVLVHCAERVLDQGLRVLGVPRPDHM